MSKYELSENEIIKQLEKNLSNNIVKKAEDKRTVLLIKLNSIADKLEELKFEKEAEAITSLIEVFVKSSVNNLGFNKLALDLTEGLDEYKREESEGKEEDLEDKYLDILLGDGNYDKSLNELSKNHVGKEYDDDYLNTLLDTKSYDDILAELEKNKPEEDEVSLDYL